MTDNHTNLPILDDIIKPGDTDKAVRQPASKVQSSLWSDEKRNDASTTGTDDENNAGLEGDDRPDSIELCTDNQSANDAIDQTQVPLVTETDDELAIDESLLDAVNAEAGEARASATHLPDLDAMTEEILGNIMLDVEQRLREKIRKRLSRHFSGETGSD